MASVSVTHMIIFIASIIVAASVAGVLTQEVARLSAAIDEQGIDVATEIRTDIEIISDAGSDNIYDSSSDNITILIKNTGSNQLTADTDQVEVLVDGEFQDPDNVSLSVVDGDLWETNNVVRMNVTDPNLPSGDHRVKVIVNGDEEVFEFNT